MKDLLPISFLSFAMWGLVHVCTYFLSNMWAQLIVGTLVGAAFYLGVAYLFKFEEIKDVKYLLNRKK